MWEQIRSNRIRSAFVVSIMGVLLVGLGLFLGIAFGGGGLTDGPAIMGGLVALAVWAVMWLVSISQGDQVMLKMAGARRIQKKDHPQLWNIVEEMTIASSLGKMPAVYIVDDPSPNAFATGRKAENASVAVTTGLLRVLNRDELQGVVAHELGHIKNRDIALLTTAGVMMGAIVLLSEVGLRAMWYGGGRRRSRSSNDNDGGAQAIMAIIAVVLMILAPILAQLVYFALSRRREYLADASGALFTRYPEGLASALEKLSGSKIPLADKSKVTAPMYIVTPLRQGEAMAASSMTATHPPIADRVRILRSMGGGADFAAYEKAYEQVKKGGHVIGAQTLKGAQPVAAFATPPSGGASASAAALAEPALNTKTQRRRAAMDGFLTASGYERLVCGGCSAVLKVPSGLKGRVAQCPRCLTSLDEAYPAP